MMINTKKLLNLCKFIELMNLSVCYLHLVYQPSNHKPLKIYLCLLSILQSNYMFTL